MKRILVAEDEDTIREFVVINLVRGGYDVAEAADGEKAWELFKNSGGNFDIALMDIMMPGMDGFTLCKKIRAENSDIGIIILSAKTQEMDKVTGLMLGADDYVTKPFSPSELVARVDAVYRRVSAIAGRNEPKNEIVSGPFVLNLASRSLRKNGEVIELTQVEFQLMEMFLSNQNVALDREHILQKVWGEHYEGDVKIVDVNIRRLRMKIEDEPSAPAYIATVWGYGYKWTV